MYVYLFYIFIRLMLLGQCSQHYFILVMNPVTFNIIIIIIIIIIREFQKEGKSVVYEERKWWKRSEKI